MTLLWRGAIGGVVGSLLKAVAAWIYYSFINPPKTWGYLGRNPVVYFAILGIPLAAGIGAMVGAILRSTARTTDRSLGLLARMILGASIVGVLGAVFMHPNAGLPISNLSSWFIASLFYWDFGVITGATAGIFAVSRKMGALSQHERMILTGDVKRSMLPGAVGGLLGGVIGAVVVLPKLPQEADTSNHVVFLMHFLIWHLPVTALAGALIGLTLPLIHTKTDSKFGVVTRIIIAAIMGGLIGAIIDSLVLTTAALAILGHFYTEYGAIVGTLSGLIVAIQRSSKNNSSSPNNLAM